jgi:hypothetical protein
MMSILNPKNRNADKFGWVFDHKLINEDKPRRRATMHEATTNIMSPFSFSSFNYFHYLHVLSNNDTTTTTNAPHLHPLAEDRLSFGRRRPEKGYLMKTKDADH